MYLCHAATRPRSDCSGGGVVGMLIRARDRSLSDMVADRIRLFMGLEELGETEGEWLGEGAWGRVERREETGEGAGEGRRTESWLVPGTLQSFQ